NPAMVEIATTPNVTVLATMNELTSPVTRWEDGSDSAVRRLFHRLPPGRIGGGNRVASALVRLAMTIIHHSGKNDSAMATIRVRRVSGVASHWCEPARERRPRPPRRRAGGVAAGAAAPGRLVAAVIPVVISTPGCGGR